MHDFASLISGLGAGLLLLNGFVGLLGPGGVVSEARGGALDDEWRSLGGDWPLHMSLEMLQTIERSSLGRSVQRVILRRRHPSEASDLLRASRLSQLLLNFLRTGQLGHILHLLHLPLPSNLPLRLPLSPCFLLYNLPYNLLLEHYLLLVEEALEVVAGHVLAVGGAHWLVLLSDASWLLIHDQSIQIGVRGLKIDVALFNVREEHIQLSEPILNLEQVAHILQLPLPLNLVIFRYLRIIHKYLIRVSKLEPMVLPPSLGLFILLHGNRHYFLFDAFYGKSYAVFDLLLELSLLDKLDGRVGSGTQTLLEAATFGVVRCRVIGCSDSSGSRSVMIVLHLFKGHL